MNGFATLGGPHICMLVCCMAAGAVLVFLTEKPGYVSMFASGAAGRQGDAGACPAPVKAAAVALIALEAAQDAYLLITGVEPVMEHLPLHLCSLGIFVNLYGAFSQSRLSAALREISLMLIAPGAVFALLFPDWTYMPLLSALSVIGFISHTLLVAVPLMMLRAGAVRPAVRHSWYPLAFLAVVSPPVFLFDRVFGYNYLFLRSPVEGTPLAWWAARLGEPGYLLGVLLMILALLALEYAAVYACGRDRL
jgi:uncharacterized membrane protein YwaF